MKYGCHKVMCHTFFLSLLYKAWVCILVEYTYVVVHNLFKDHTMSFIYVEIGEVIRRVF